MGWDACPACVCVGGGGMFCALCCSLEVMEGVLCIALFTRVREGCFVEVCV